MIMVTNLSLHEFHIKYNLSGIGDDLILLVYTPVTSHYDQPYDPPDH